MRLCEYLKDKFNHLEKPSRNKTIRDVYGDPNQFNKGSSLGKTW
jgi:hypothetical protein